MAAKNNWRRYGTKLRHCHPGFLGSTSLHLQKDIDWFSRSALLTCLASAQYTDTRTTLRRTRVGKGGVYALHAGDAPTKKLTAVDTLSAEIRRSAKHDILLLIY